MAAGLINVLLKGIKVDIAAFDVTAASLGGIFAGIGDLVNGRRPGLAMVLGLLRLLFRGIATGFVDITCFFSPIFREIPAGLTDPTGLGELPDFITLLISGIIAGLLAGALLIGIELCLDGAESPLDTGVTGIGGSAGSAASSRIVKSGLLLTAVRVR
jgi:hypothetical protein